MFIKKLTQRGDTVVEVLVSIGVLSLILGGAYVLTNRSLQATRSAQERLNATKLVETQLEQIKNFAATDPTALFVSAPDPFCINNAGQIKPAADSGCRVGPDGGAPAAQPIFSLSARRTGNTFKVTNSWDSITGRGVETVQMSYKVYE